MTYAENGGASLSGPSFTVQLDHRGSSNIVPSRGVLLSSDTLPPGRAQLLQVANVGAGEGAAQIRCQMR